MILELSFLVFGALFGWFRFIRSWINFRWVFVSIWGSVLIFRFLFRAYNKYPSESYMTNGEIWAYLIWPAIFYLTAGYLLGEGARAISIAIFGEVPEHEAGRPTQFFNNLGARIFNIDRSNFSRDSELRTAIDLSSWLYLGKCKSRKRLASAIGREYDLSPDDRIGLFLELNTKASCEPNSLPPTKAFLKQNRSNHVSRENLYETVIRIGLLSGIDLNTVKPRLITLTENLDIELSRAEQIVQNVIDAIEKTNDRTRYEREPEPEPDFQENRHRKRHKSKQYEPVSSLTTNLAILGLRPGAKIKDVKSAYRKMAKKFHPDSLHATNASEKDRKQAEMKMVKLNAAYDWLLDALSE